MFLTKVAEKIKNTHFMFSNLFPKIVSCMRYSGELKYSRTGHRCQYNTARSIGCWIPKAKNAHSDYVILIVFPLQQWSYEGASMLRYTYTVCHPIWNVMECWDSKLCPSVMITSSWRKKTPHKSF